MGVLTKALDLWDILGGEEPRSRKGLSISLDPSGFVTEIRDYRRPSSLHSDTTTLQDAMSRNELVFACLGVKATAAHDPRLLVQKAVKKGDKVEYEEVQGHAFRSLIMRPNPMMTEADLMRAAIISWDISNPRRFYAEKEYEGSLLKHIWPLNPACMRPLPSRVDANRSIGYVWSDGTERREYAYEELIIRAAPAWYDPPPTVAALGAIESDSAQTDYVRAFFEGGGIPPGILKYKNVRLNQAQRDEVRDKWRSVHGNAFGKQFDIGVLDAEVDFQQTGSKLDELQSQILRSVAESRICMVYKVPPLIVYAYVGLIRATYSNLKEAWAGFWDATMSPTFKEWRDFWTWNLLTEFEDEKTIRGEQIRLNYDMSQVAALQDDVDAMQTRARANFQSGGISLNEFRAAVGYAPIVGADVPSAAPAPKMEVASEKADSATPAPPSPFLSYHIAQGVVSKNEVRAQLGLPPETDLQDQQLRRLQSTLSVLIMAVQARIPLEAALKLVGLEVELPEGGEVQSPVEEVQPVSPPQLVDTEKRSQKAKAPPSLQVIERRIEKAVQSYLHEQYMLAAQAVGG